MSSVGAVPTAVTVVVPTAGRDESLARTLNGLARTRSPVEWELVVVDNSTRAGLGPLASAALGHLHVRVRILRETEPGASAARNAGLAVAAPVVAFLDDDAIPEPGWLAAVTAPILAGEATGAGGPVRLDPSVRRPRWLADRVMPLLSAYDRPAGPLSPGDYVLTANAAFDTARLRALGGFDVRLGPRPGQQLTNDDVDLCHRLQASGATLVFVADAVVTHEMAAHRLRLRYLWHRSWCQGRSDRILEQLEGTTPEPGHVRQLLRSQLAHALKAEPKRPATAVAMLCDTARAGGYLWAARGPGSTRPWRRNRRR